VPHFDRLGEEARWAFLLGLAVLHVLWIAATYARHRVLRARLTGQGLDEGRGTLRGAVTRDQPICVGDSFVLRLEGGREVEVRVSAATALRTSTIRAWEREGRLLAGERLVVDGVISRLTSDHDGYRESERRFVVDASATEPLLSGDPVVRVVHHARRLAGLGALALALWGAWAARFVVLSLAGAPTEATAELSSVHHEGELARGTGHVHASSVERLVRVRVRRDDGVLELEDHLTEAGHEHLFETHRATVWVAAIGPLEFGQIGDTPGLSSLAPYVAFAELAAAMLGLYLLLRPERRRSDRFAWGDSAPNS
jgi:hypothetical protein